MTEPLTPVRRLSLSEILTMMLTRGGERDSVTVARNARGVYQFEVTARTSEGETIEDA